MSNSSFSKNKLITPEKAAIILPTFISFVISIIVVSSFSIPKYIFSNKKNNEYKEYLRKQDQLPILKSQYEIINKKLQDLNYQKEKIINLISGTSKLDTFITRLGSLARKNNIKFVNIIPKTYVKYVDSENQDIQSELNINNDPLLVEGVKKYILDINFQAKYQDLLSFLRDLESQENVILIKDMNVQSLQYESESGNESIGLLEVAFKMLVYGKV